MQTITYLDDCFNKGKLSRWADGVMPLKVYIGKFNWYKSAGSNDEYKYTQMIIDGFNLWEQKSNGLVSFERTMNLYDSNINIYLNHNALSLGYLVNNSHNEIYKNYNTSLQFI